MADQAFKYGIAQNLTENSFTRTGYLFNGWKDDSGNTYTNGKSVNNLTTTNNGTVTLYAQWKAISVTLPTATKSGYTCKWTTVDGGNKVERPSGGTWTFTSANLRTFTCECTKNPTTQYTVTLNNNGATTAGTGSVKVSVSML